VFGVWGEKKNLYTRDDDDEVQRLRFRSYTYLGRCGGGVYFIYIYITYLIFAANHRVHVAYMCVCVYAYSCRRNDDVFAYNYYYNIIHNKRRFIGVDIIFYTIVKLEATQIANLLKLKKTTFS